MNIKIKDMVTIAFMSAIMCVVGPLSINLPVSPVPITLVNLVVYISLFILGTYKTLISFLLYMLIGFVGVPVFSNFSGGPVKILGPTGGYIIGYIFLIVVTGFIMERFDRKLAQSFIALIIGTLILYLFGTMWLSVVAHMTFVASLMAGVVPFIIGDLVKIIISLMIGTKIRAILIGLK